jgi:DNA replication and repair protein RecF
VQLEWLELRGVRCHHHLEFRPDPGINVLVGPNGAGKTTVLEGMAYLSRLRSFRGVADEALVGDGEEAAIIRGRFRKGSSTVTVEVEIPAEGRRRVLLEGKRPRRHSDLASLLPVVTFLPDDLDVVKRGPAERRAFLDDLAAQLWPAAGAEQQEYARVVRQRNALLREDGPRAAADTLDVWDQQLAAAGAAVLARRLQVLDRCSPGARALYRRIGDGDELLRWSYASRGAGELDGSVPAGEIARRLRGSLAERRRVDLERRTTTVGPHRDDIVFELDGRDVRSRASQGEQRSVALVLRLVAFDVVEEQFGAPPLLLLDDVFSELDGARAAAVVERLPGGQVMVTTARPEDVPVEGRTWRVGGGGVS